MKRSFWDSSFRIAVLVGFIAAALSASLSRAAAPPQPEEVPCAKDSKAFYDSLNHGPRPAGVEAQYPSATKPVLPEPAVATPPAQDGDASGNALPL